LGPSRPGVLSPIAWERKHNQPLQHSLTDVSAASYDTKMADTTLVGGADALEETLGRLTKKVGVKATIVLDRAKGSILRTSGQISSIRTAKSTNGSGLPIQAPSSFDGDTNAGVVNEAQGAEELAALVWSFTRTAGSLVQEIDTEDELKLLRLRTKKQELVIVPDSKYILIVIHDTPPA